MRYYCRYFQTRRRQSAQRRNGLEPRKVLGQLLQQLVQHPVKKMNLQEPSRWEMSLEGMSLQEMIHWVRSLPLEMLVMQGLSHQMENYRQGFA